MKLSTRRRIAISFGVLIALGIVLVGWTVRELRTPVAHARSQQYIEIPRGYTPAAIVQKLYSEGVIRHKWPLLVYIKITRSGSNLKAGEYRFPSPISPARVLRKLLDGEHHVNRFTVIEGWTRWDIAAAMHKIPVLKLQSPTEALALMDDVQLITDLDPSAKNLEGYLYPDTYIFPDEMTPASLIAEMVKRFKIKWNLHFAEKAKNKNMSPKEVTTIASLIETEAKLPEERPLISSVIQNRLKREMYLGIDSTAVYASKLAGKWRNDGKVYKSDIERASPYNTRLRSGLPPGPIGAAGQRSLEAALNPADTDYLYYVREPSRDDGAHNFYNNEQDFQKGVEALRNWERERDAREAEKKRGL